MLQVIDPMNGRIGVDSRRGEGSFFWVELPWIAAPAAAALPEAAVDAPRLDGVQLLLAEDNELNQEVARAMLVRAGAAVDVAGDGRTALGLARRQPCHAILRDVQMPVMDGLEATRLIRLRPQHAHTLIVAMTAHVLAEDQQACTEAGMNDHLAKPMQAQAMVLTMSRWCHQAPTG